MTINNITNVTNVTNVQVNHRHHKSHWSDGGKHNHGNRHKLEHKERKPALLRFFGSCGLLDRDKAERSMDCGTFANDAIDVLHYTSRDFVNNVKGIGLGVCQIGGAVGRAIGGVSGWIARALK